MEKNLSVYKDPGLDYDIDHDDDDDEQEVNTTGGFSPGASSTPYHRESNMKCEQCNMSRAGFRILLIWMKPSVWRDFHHLKKKDKS